MMTRELAPLKGELRALVDAERAAAATPTPAQLEGAGQRIWATLALPGSPPLPTPAAPAATPTVPATPTAPASAPSAGAPTAAAATSAALGGAGTAALLKPLALVAMVAITGAGTYLALQHRPNSAVIAPSFEGGAPSSVPPTVRPTPAVVPPSAVASAPATPTAGLPSPTPAPVTPKTKQQPSPTTAHRLPRGPARAASIPSSVSSMGAERRILERARAALARGNVKEARKALQVHQRRYPRGALAEERQALEVLRLAREKRLPEARRAAARFHARHPRSLLWPAIQRALGR